MSVPSHIGIPGNEKAASTAKIATSSPPSKEKKINLTTLSETLNIIQTKVKEKWEKYWTNRLLSNKLRYIKFSIKHWTYPHDITKRDEVIII